MNTDNSLKLLSSVISLQLRNFIAENYQDVRKKLRRSKRIKLTMPKFSIKTEVDLVEQMRALGISEAFSKGKNYTEL